VHVLGGVAAHNLIENGAQFSGHDSHHTFAHRSVVHLRDGRYLRGSAGFC